MEDAARFWAKVDRRGEDECWPWLRGRNGQGYGQFTMNGKYALAHRFAYELEVGPIPDGLSLDHLCRVRACCNPAHLEPVSTKENVLRGVSFAALNAAKTHCPHGHEYTGANTYYRPNGKRVCRTCRNEGKRRRRKGLA